MFANSCRKKQISSQIFSHLLDIIYLFVSKFTAQHSTAQHSTAQHSTAQHSTALVLRFSGKLAKQAQLATSTSYNSARNIISGYMHFKSNITTFSHRKTAHDAGKIMSCTWAFHILNLPFYVERFWHHSFSSHFYNLAKGDAS